MDSGQTSNPPRFDCYQQLTTGDLAFSADHVSIEFKRAKKDQFYAGSICLLSILPGSPYCPQLVYSSYLKVMKFKEGGGDFLNCRVLKSKNLYRAKGSEKLSYSNSSRDTKVLLQLIRFKGNFTEKSFKVLY